LVAAVAQCLVASAQQKPASVGIGEQHLPKNIRPATRDVTTHEDFVARRSGSGPARPQRNGGVEKPAVPVTKSYDLLEHSTILKGQGTFTLVPQNAVIVIPDRHKERVAEGPQGRFQIWGEFLIANRGWLQTFEVTIDQARGRKPLEEQTLELLSKRENVIVATLTGNPISVNTPPAAAEDAAAGEDETAGTP
jgi:hypothetical protein